MNTTMKSLNCRSDGNTFTTAAIAQTAKCGGDAGVMSAGNAAPAWEQMFRKCICNACASAQNNWGNMQAKRQFAC